ncbi:acyl carrier protein [Aquimarina muelleri]|uniref:Acyl carrier protein n=1 Tax=Aquimarina muelleri TaxID=279356 RepID=A0A918JZW0_9FLAO|nr:acyl carrier protein [Aquimarina muelleri]MCX2763247.1 acyl carrier protein [Aquimarina muelleri]GGX27701.1 hypothetical protein GCM10007384_31240 [Aquimarina muelleri]
MNTSKELLGVFAKAFSTPIEEITEELEYQGIAEWDSMSHLVLVEEIESAYKVSIEMEDVLEMGSVTKVKDMLKKYGIKII